MSDPGSDMSEAATSAGKLKRRRRWLVIVGLFLLLVIVAAPYIVAATGLRDVVLQSTLGEPALNVTTGSASFGWLSPLAINDLAIRSDDNSFSITIKRLTASKSWLPLWLNSPRIGNLDVDGIHVEVNIHDDHQGASTIQNCPIVAATLHDASLIVRQRDAEKPVVDIRKMKVDLRTEQRSDAGVLIIDPIQLVDQASLTTEICKRGMQLVAPELSDEISVSGQYSCELTNMEFVLGSDASAESKIEGVVTLHEVDASLTNDVTKRLALLAAAMLELADVPKQIKLIDHTTLKFRLTEDGIDSDGMAYLLSDLAPGLSISSAGKVGWDESLSLKVLVRVPMTKFEQNDVARELEQHALELNVAGTIDKPKWECPQDQPWMRTLSERISSSATSPEQKEFAKRILHSLHELREELASQ